MARGWGGPGLKLPEVGRDAAGETVVHRVSKQRDDRPGSHHDADLADEPVRVVDEDGGRLEPESPGGAAPHQDRLVAVVDLEGVLDRARELRGESEDLDGFVSADDRLGQHGREQENVGREELGQLFGACVGFDRAAEWVL